MKERQAISARIKTVLWIKFQELARKSGVSASNALERLMQSAVNQGQITGIQALEDHETRENEKWGPATPVYGGEAEKPASSETQTAKPRPQSS